MRKRVGVSVSGFNIMYPLDISKNIIKYRNVLPGLYLLLWAFNLDPLTPERDGRTLKDEFFGQTQPESGTDSGIL